MIEGRSEASDSKSSVNHTDSSVLPTRRCPVTWNENVILFSGVVDVGGLLAVPPRSVLNCQEMDNRALFFGCFFTYSHIFG